MFKINNNQAQRKEKYYKIQKNGMKTFRIFVCLKIRIQSRDNGFCQFFGFFQKVFFLNSEITCVPCINIPIPDNSHSFPVCIIKKTVCRFSSIAFRNPHQNTFTITQIIYINPSIDIRQFVFCIFGPYCEVKVKPCCNFRFEQVLKFNISLMILEKSSRCRKYAACIIHFPAVTARLFDLFRFYLLVILVQFCSIIFSKPANSCEFSKWSSLNS